MNRHLVRVVSALVLVAGLSVASLAQHRHFVVVHSNDTHGHLIPYSLPSHVPPGDRTVQLPFRKDIGGVARRATIIRRIRAANPLVKCFDAGDNMDGTLFSTEYRDKADYAALNAMHYDYCVTGNHEYSLGADELGELLTTLTPKMVVANVVDRSTKKPIATPYVIDRWDGIRVAIVGLVTSETKSYRAAKERFDILDPIKTAKELVPMLRKKADLVIFVTHIGVTMDEQLATEVPGIDVIVGGHSHTRLPHGVYQQASHPGPRDPKGTIIVQTGSYGAELGKLDLELERKNGHWRIAKYADSLIALSAGTPEDSAVKAVVDTYWQPIYAKYHDTLATAEGDFTDYENEPSTNYYLVSDACQQYGNCQFSLQNVGGVRAPLVAGPVTRYDLVSMVPFVDTLAIATITGASLDSLLNETFAQPSREMHYTVYHVKADSARHRVESWRTGNLTIAGKPVHPDSTYTFTAADFFMHMVQSHLLSVRNLDRTSIDALSDYVQRRKTLAPSADDRITVSEE